MAPAQSLPSTSRRFTQLRKELAAAMAAPVFTAAERARAEQNALACADLRRLILWLRNVARVAADRAVVAAKARTAARRTAAAQQTSTALNQARQAINALLSGPMFNDAESLRGTHFACQCNSLRLLQHWVGALHVEKDAREAALWLAYETSCCVHVPTC